MANVVPHLGMRFTSSADDPETGIIATYDLAMDSPANYQAQGGRLSKVDFIAQPVPEALLTETVRTDSPAGKITKGKGLLLKIDLTVSWKTGKAPDVADTSEGEVGTVEADGWAIAGYLAKGMSGQTDGYSVYCWISTNYQWMNPDAPEQWLRVVPDIRTYKQGFGSEKRQTWGFSVSLLSFKNYVSITPRNWRRGFVYAGAGTLTATNGSDAVTGQAGSEFLSEFMHGDRVYQADGVTLIGIVESVEADDALTLRENYTGTTYTTSAYVTHQRSNSDWSVPVYTFEEFSTEPYAPSAVVMFGLLSQRPAASSVGNAFFYATDTKEMFFSNGTYWVLTQDKFRRTGWWTWTGVAGTRVGIGVATPDTFSFSAMSNEPEGRFGLFDNSISAGVGRWGTSANDETCTRNAPVMRARIKTGPNATDIQNCRIRCGLYSTGPYGSGAMTSDLCGFRYLPALDTVGKWHTETADGVTAHVVTTAQNIVHNTVYELTIDARDPASIKFYVNDVLVATHAVNLPAETTLLGGYVAIEATSSSQKMLIDAVSFEQD